MDHLLHLLLIGYMGLNGADLALTEYCLGQGQCRELNPVFAPLSRSPLTFGVAKMTGATAIALALHKLTHSKHPKLAVVVSAASVAWSAGVVIHNQRQLRGRRVATDGRR